MMVMKGRINFIYFLIGGLIMVEACNTDPSGKNGEASNLSVSTTPYPKGQELYNSTCKVCHQENGEGVPNTFPPLAKSDYLLSDKSRAIRQVIHGSNGEIKVNGVSYNGIMPPQVLTDEEVAEVLNYVLHSWGNNGPVISKEEVESLH